VYFESGFPYEKDQWISISATSWATAALALTVPPPDKDAGPEKQASPMPEPWSRTPRTAERYFVARVSTCWTPIRPPWLTCCRGAASVGALPDAVTMTRWYRAVRTVAMTVASEYNAGGWMRA
jgi:hypothetical protein